ncbi:hypothetical protein FRB97_002704 [Tulasnella sp. 331]|nr:hypothetical protein FRB97_002704 [Tulasnella sp. 331]
MSAFGPQYPEWMRNGKISSSMLRQIYTSLMSREHARMDLRKASREVVTPPRFNEQPSTASLVKSAGKKVSKLKGLIPGLMSMNNPSMEELSPGQHFYSVHQASQPITQNRNRYRDIEPYDRNLVLVGTLRRDDGRYLNASWVREVEGKAWWIAAQAPLMTTTHAFLSLFTSLQPAELRPRVIVQLTPIAENGIRKADQYIPETVNSESLHFFPEPECDGLPHIEVSLTSESSVPAAGCVIRKLDLKLLPASVVGGGSEATTEITHIDYHGWPDHSIPKDPNELIGLAQVVASVNSSSSNSTANPDSGPPILCHCSAGVGRTGTFIAISSLLRAAGRLPSATGAPQPRQLTEMFAELPASPLGPLPSPGIGDDPVAREVDGLREQRTTMVQRSEQLGIIYQIMMNVLNTS